MDVSAVVAEQRRFFDTGVTRDVAFRVRQLQRLKAALRAAEPAFIEALNKDFGRSEFDTFTLELMWLYRDLDEASSQVPKWAKRKRVPTNWFNQWGRSYVMPEPLGVCLVIGAWNYPYRLSLAPVVGALAAGNTVMLKPSELASHASQCMHAVISQHFEPGYLSVVQGDASVATALLDQRFDKVFFTGSTRVGKLVYQAAAKHLTPVSLELGGKSPAFVTRGCDVQLAAERIAWAKYVNAGQTCIAPDYVLVDETIEAEFCTALQAEITKANYSLSNGNYVRIVNDAHVARLAAMIDANKVFVGGKVDRAERLIEPTVLRGVNLEDACMQQEIFGPILPVLSVQSLDEAIGIVKRGEKPLSGYVFCNDVDVRERILSEVSFGGGCVNDAGVHIANPQLPFGGVGHSGIGAYQGEAGFKAFSHFKSVLERGTMDSRLRFTPNDAKKLKMVRWLSRWALD